MCVCVFGWVPNWEQHEDHEAPLHQMTASAIGNIPEGNIDGVKAAIASAAFNLDSRGFNFEVSCNVLPFPIAYPHTRKWSTSLSSALTINPVSRGYREAITRSQGSCGD